MKKIKLIVISLIVIMQSSFFYSQNWQTGILNNGALGVNLGNSVNQPINIFTANLQKAQFSTGFSLGPGIIPSANMGDGLRIMPRTTNCGSPSLPGLGALDLWTGCSNNTNIRWDGSGQISGTNNRFEQWANLNGFFFNTTSAGGIGVYKFARSQTVTAFVGTNNFWRIGEQADPVNLNGQRRLHVVDNTTQFRLSFAGPSSNGAFFTDFLSNSVGNLQIQPITGRVGINASTDPTATIDVFGDARIRDVQTAMPDALFIGIEASGAANPQDLNVRRLDFSGNSNDVLQGNGTWGPAASPITANNGITLTPGDVVQLGEPYNAAATVPLLNNREVRMNNRNFVFSRTNAANTGNVGIGLIFPSAPTQRLDVDGNARLRRVPTAPANYIMTGLQVGVNPNDIVFRKTAFPMDNTQVLHGDGTWGPVPAGNAGPVGATGPAGPMGPIGLTGVTGPQGNAGPVGGTGPQGPAGLPGASGPQGLTGATGLQGPAGFSTGAHNGTSMSLIDPTKVAFGQNLNQAGNLGELLNDREIPMNNQSIFFTDNSAIAGNAENRIGVGTANPSARMHITVNNMIQENTPIGLIVENNQTTLNGFSSGSNIIVNGANALNSGQNIIVSGAANNFGLDASAAGGNQNSGVIGRATEGTISNYGLTGEAISTITVANNNFGVHAKAIGGINNSGGHFEAGSMSPSLNSHGVYSVASGFGLNNYGIHTQASVGVNNYGIYSVTDYLPTTFAGFFIGNVHVTGQISSTNGTVITSDQQFKTNVQDITNAMDILNGLQPKTFNYDTMNYADFGFESDQQMGLVAQEVEQIIPTIVSNHIRPAQFDSLGMQTSPEVSYKGVEYEELIPLLIAGAQEQNDVIESQDSVITAQQTEIDDLNDRLTQLENCLSGILPFLCQMNNSSIQPTQEIVQEQLRAAINVNLSDRNSIVLNQNVPNPFAESTIITFSIPTSVQKAQIHFYDGQGKLINSVDIVERGNGQLNVFANDLSTGVYTYSLVADGQIVSTKRMVKE